MFKFFKRLFCFHEWDCISDVWTCDASTVRYRCLKCGKVEGL